MKKLTKAATGIVSTATALATSAYPAMAAVTAPNWALYKDKDGIDALGLLITNVLNIVFAIGVILALFYLIWGALTWIMSGGDKGKTADARNKIIGAVVGLILLAATWAILNLVLRVIYGSNYTVDKVINENLKLQ